jgi:proteasome lid subunit RPN8/RPN11
MKISDDIFRELLVAAREDAPLEACGILAGADGVVEKFYRMTNADASAEHYTMIPEEQFAAVKDMRELGLTMLAVWHSHPATPARMSEEDLKLAYMPETIYAILSLENSDEPVLKGFEVVDGEAREVDVKRET